MKVDLNEKSQFVSVEKINAYDFKLSTVQYGRPAHVVFSDAAREELILALFKVGNNELAELQKEIAPDYPIETRNTLHDYIWAIRAAYQGCTMANDDLHNVIKTLTEGKTLEERFQIYLFAEQNANLIEENLKLQRELDELRARFC